ncbi:hypothetical protein QUF84_11420 [Fictibacillus enclensis]|nr:MULTISPECIES: hypothetical protein [Fictibacillus]MDM5198627.1 hypothetical protein [Fictibacillus enclensis]MDM5337830.1 hypothetical protein [Fictibacillus enclensis]WHY74192.1 hypothetical protein QNH15_09895 [Fictibacillus enclensis]SCB86932.1 hypothetical protein GA0061096_1020 [Fictibacillus enclensis]
MKAKEKKKQTKREMLKEMLKKNLRGLSNVPKKGPASQVKSIA